MPTLQAMAAYPALLLSFAVPAGPGYLGNLEVAGSLVLGGGLGLAPAVAAGAIVLYHAVTAGYALALGLVGFLLVGGRRRVRAGGPRQIAVFHCGFTYSGGGERIVIEEVLGLRRRGFKVECYAPTVDASRCYPDLIGEVRVRTFLPQLPRWFPYREAIQMAAASLLMPLYAWRLARYRRHRGVQSTQRVDRVVGRTAHRRPIRRLSQSTESAGLSPEHRPRDGVGRKRRLPAACRHRAARHEVRCVGRPALSPGGGPAAGQRRLHRRHHPRHLQTRSRRLPGRMPRGGDRDFHCLVRRDSRAA